MFVYTYNFFSEWQANFSTYQQILHQMAKVYQRVIVGKVEMDHPNHSTSHDPEIIKHIQLLLIKSSGHITSFCVKRLFNAAATSSKLRINENDRIIINNELQRMWKKDIYHHT
jgi:hypothetical protein